VLAYLAAEVLAEDVGRRPARADEGCPDGRVEREVDVAGAGEAVPRVLAPPPADERPGTPPEPCPLQPIGAAAVLEDPRRVDADALDRRRTVGRPVDLGR